MPSESVHCCVTSPPYWGLRNYNMEGQLGLEATPEAYVTRLVGILGEVRRVLRANGTLWLNLGDSYATGAGSARVAGGKVFGKANGMVNSGDFPTCQPNRMPLPGLKPKDLVGIPWMVASALRADGWYLRSDIIWAKPAPMPESVTDRPTRSYEHIFLMAKSKIYHCDMESIKEPAVSGWKGSRFDGPRDLEIRPDTGRRPSAKRGDFKGKTEAMAATGQNAFRAVTERRNRRDVWTVNTKPFKGAHFALFPPKLIEPCILAGCPEGGIVLDPFAGAGTTGLVSQQHGRDFVGIELNPAYVKMARARLALVSDPSEPRDLTQGSSKPKRGSEAIAATPGVFL